MTIIFERIARGFLVLLGAVGLQAGCGVKGDPEPPGTPVQIGRGRPMYRGLLEEGKTNPFGPTDSGDQNHESKKEKGAR